METFLLSIHNKRFYKEGEKSFSFLHSPYGGRWVNIPKSLIQFYDLKKDWHEFELPKWYYEKIEDDLNFFKKTDIKLDI